MTSRSELIDVIINQPAGGRRQAASVNTVIGHTSHVRVQSMIGVVLWPIATGVDDSPRRRRGDVSKTTKRVFTEFSKPNQSLDEI